MCPKISEYTSFMPLFWENIKAPISPNLLCQHVKIRKGIYFDKNTKYAKKYENKRAHSKK